MISPLVEEARITKAKRDCPTPLLTPEDCIKKALEEYNSTMSWSGGRCSTAVLFLTLLQNPDVRVIFNDTGVEFPETYAFVDKIKDEWNVNLEILKPKTTFWAVVEEYGFPMIRGKYYRDSKSKDGRPKCCTLLKEEPLKRAKISSTITGIRVAESRMRMFGVGQYGQYYYAKTLDMWKFHPIAFWSTEKLLKFHEENRIPQNEVYAKGQFRCGCWPCTGYLTWKDEISKSHPKMYRVLAKMVGEPTLWEYQDLEGCRQEAVAV